MSIVIGLLTAVLVVVCLLIVFIVLMQRPKQEGLGAAFGGGVTDQMLGAHTTNVLQKATVYLAVLFFGITLLMQVLIARKQNKLDTLGKDLAPAAAPAATTDPSGDGSVSIPATTPIEVIPSPAETATTPVADPAAATETPEATPESTPEPATPAATEPATETPEATPESAPEAATPAATEPAATGDNP